jgi:hypothetical protein
MLSEKALSCPHRPAQITKGKVRTFSPATYPSGQQTYRREDEWCFLQHHPPPGGESMTTPPQR